MKKRPTNMETLLLEQLMRADLLIRYYRTEYFSWRNVALLAAAGCWVEYLLTH